MTLPRKIYLIDLDVHLVKEWREQFKNYPSIVEAKVCDYFDIPADAMVSPANSFGYMDGGLDRAICYELGAELQETVQTTIIKTHHGELPIGSAIIIETASTQWTYLVIAPTMRVPEDVSGTLNAYLAFRAILLEIMKHNTNHPKAKINSLVCSGLATGIGKLSPKQCAIQMKMAYEQCLNPARIMNPSEIYVNHSTMNS
jgi:O-acetyl-ADP-ribose deacetylase (regulator of RNase III)